MVPAVRSVITLDKKLVIGHVLLGQALVSQDSLALAQKSYETALTIDPANAKALRGLGFIPTAGPASDRRTWGCATWTTPKRRSARRRPSTPTTPRSSVVWRP